MPILSANHAKAFGTPTAKRHEQGLGRLRVRLPALPLDTPEKKSRKCVKTFLEECDGPEGGEEVQHR